MMDQAAVDYESEYIKKKGDPEYLLLFVDKFVKAQLIKNTSYSGFVQSIDPVSKSVILQVPHSESFQTTLLPGHAILDVVIQDAPDNIKPPEKQNLSPNYSEEVVTERKNKLLTWLKDNLLPATEDGKNIVVGSVTILPPYGMSEILANSPVVAAQFRSILGRMPKE